jgi:hypothetical protein
MAQTPTLDKTLRISFASIWSLSTLLLLSQPLLCFIFREKSDDSARGVRLSGNDQFTVFAMNVVRRIMLAFYPYKPSDQFFIPYPLENIYVYSLAALSNNDKTMAPELLKFIQVSEDTITENVYLTLFTINKSNGGMSQKLSYEINSNLNFSKSRIP